jgi:hypothetical protein
MTPEQEARLKKEYPALFPQDLCFEIGAGWADLVERIARELREVGIGVRAEQVKEKFGGLRFYIAYLDERPDREAVDRVGQVIRRAEDESFTICEDCGAAGKLGGHGWVRTSCAQCRAAQSQA